MLSDDARAGVAKAGDVPVVALDGKQLLVVAIDVESPDQGVARLRCSGLPLQAATSIEIADELEPETRGIMRRRTWTFRAAGRSSSFETEEQLGGSFRRDLGPRSGEVVAREAARQLGWPIPEDANFMS